MAVAIDLAPSAERRPASDHRQGDRDLDPGEDLALPEAHPAGGLDELAIDPRDPGVGVHEDRRDAPG